MPVSDDEFAYLRHRLARLEMIVSSLIAFDADVDVGDEFIWQLRHGKLKSPYLEDDFLHRVLRELRQRPSRLLPLEKRLATLEAKSNATSDEHRVLQHELHGFLAIQTLGLNLTDVPLPRYLPMRVYLSEANASQVEAVSGALQSFAEGLGFTISDEFPEEKGSWFKKWFAKTKEAVTQPEVMCRLEKMERALEMKRLHEPQAEIDKKQAEAVATLVKSLEGIPTAAMQIGSLLFVKLQSPDGKPCIQVRSLTQRELVHLERNPKVLASPSDVFQRLAEVDNADGNNANQLHDSAYTLPSPSSNDTRGRLTQG